MRGRRQHTFLGLLTLGEEFRETRDGGFGPTWVRGGTAGYHKYLCIRRRYPSGLLAYEVFGHRVKVQRMPR